MNHICNALRKEDAIIGEDVIVTKIASNKYDQIGQIWKVRQSSAGIRISVSFEGEVYNFTLDDLTLA